MICFVCHQAIRGKDLPQRYEWRMSPGAARPRHENVYGKGEKPLSTAQGQLIRVSHNKCYHAYKKQQELAAAKAADPSAQPGPEQDWRHQETIDVGELTDASDRGDRGAGAAGR